jgi:surfeit locus 1 family protein
MSRKTVVFVALAVGLAALFVRLGFWQLDRLGQRKAYNAQLSARMSQAPVPFEQLGDAGSARRAFVEGVPDHANEFVQTGRSRNGSPGVYVITPVRRPGSNRAVLVNRGWVYAPDAATADLVQWRENRTRYSGYTMVPAGGQPSRGGAPGRRATRTLSATDIAALVPYPTEPLILVSRDSSGPGAPARLADIELTNGPHLSYAIQWFSFATIALVGAGIVVRRARRAHPAGSTAA